MVELKNILVGFDGSEHGLKALRIAKELTKANDAYLTVVYVHGSSLDHPVSVGTTPAGEDYMFQQYLASGLVTSSVPEGEEKTIIVEEEIPEQVISLAKTNLAGLENVKYEKRVGKADKVLVEYAKDNGMDLIIIGNRGIGGLKKLVMGSVSEKVSNDAECSVFIVK